MPVAVHSDLTAAFPAALTTDLQTVVGDLVSELPPAGEWKVELSTGPVTIPDRVYFTETEGGERTANQEIIRHCLYTRHHDGWVRQTHLAAILPEREEWVVPFVWALLGEYVVEIVSLIKANVDRLDFALYSEFLARNPEFDRRTRSRAVSYWDCYYRRTMFKSFEDYPAAAVFEKFGRKG